MGEGFWDLVGDTSRIKSFLVQGMEGILPVGDDFRFDGVLDPPPRIFERLAQIAGYTWDDSKEPFHSSYDNW